jgi:hypothetical protein
MPKEHQPKLGSSYIEYYWLNIFNKFYSLLSFKSVSIQLSLCKRTMMEVQEKVIKHKKKPDWIRVKLPTGKKYTELRGLVENYNLNTICTFW